MGNVRYRRGGRYAADMAVYVRLLSESSANEGEAAGLKARVAMAMRQEITPLQRLYLRLYYVDRMSMTQIGEQLQIDKSTVSRTIRRGEERLRRCLRFGAANLLEQAQVHTPYHAVNNTNRREGEKVC